MCRFSNGNGPGTEALRTGYQWELSQMLCRYANRNRTFIARKTVDLQNFAGTVDWGINSNGKDHLLKDHKY